MEYKVGFIGDIHGHFDELKSLVEKLEAYGVSRIISLGDLVDRGPKPHECIEFIRTHKFKTNTGEMRSLEMIVGNHEDSHMRIKFGKPYPGQTIVYKESRNPDTFKAITDEDWEFLQYQPYIIRDDKINVTALHGGVTPEMTTLDNLTLEELGRMSRVNYLKTGVPAGESDFWADSYDGRFGHIVYGHTSFDRIDRTKFATGIDGEKKGKFNAVVFSAQGEEKFFTVKATSYGGWDLGSYKTERPYAGSYFSSYGGSSKSTGLFWDDFDGLKSLPSESAKRTETKVTVKSTQPRKKPKGMDDIDDCFNTKRLSGNGNYYDIEGAARYCGCSGCKEFLKKRI